MTTKNIGPTPKKKGVNCQPFPKAFHRKGRAVRGRLPLARGDPRPLEEVGAAGGGAGAVAVAVAYLGCGPF